MKAKVKFDAAQVKGFLLHHVEKIVFGGFVVAFLMICWSAFKLKPYDKTPGDLTALADKVSKEVEAKTPPDKFADLPGVPDFNNLGAVGPAPVNSNLYRIAALSRPYEDRQEQRKQPKFFALEEPLAFAGYGGIAISETGGVERMAGSLGGGTGMGPEMAMGMGAGMGMGMAMGPGAGTTPAGMEQSGMQGSMMEAMKGRQGGQGTQGAMQGMQGAMQGMQGGMMQGPGARGRGRTPRGRNSAAKKPEAKPALPRPKPQVTEKIVLPQPPSGAHVEGRYWVCLVGAIPYEKQFTEYQNTFRDARSHDPKLDYPRYALPEIERAEVAGDGLGDWEPLNIEAVIDDFGKWAANYPDVVDERFHDPDLTEPLPPLVFANHDKEKVNHPLTKVVEKKVEAATGTKTRVRPRNLTGTANRARTGGQYANAGMGAGMGMGQRMGMGTGMAARAAGPLVEHRLFRFFDFAVDPGKTYRYRIKLVLKNPNAGVPPRFLENYEYAKGATRDADWSQPSSPVTVIAGNRLLAGSVTPGGRAEPTGKLLAKLFDATEAAEIRKIFDINRGSVLNQREIEIGLPDSAEGTSTKRSATVDFETNAVVLDLFGGEKLAGVRSSNPREESPKVPGHILVLDNDGEIKALLQASDAGMYETEAEEAKNQAAPEKKKEGSGNSPAAGSSDGGFGNFDELPEGNTKPRRRR